ncbi:MAG TPA: hypothetical protein PK077_01540 [Akkermansia muciniphila]|nr:hypothetical protein [Akkermansia muciniphila]
MNGFNQAHFQMKPFIGGPAHFIFRFRQNFHQTQDFVRMGAFDQFGEFLLGGFRERIKAGFWIYFRDQNFTHGGDNFGKELAHVSSCFRLFMQKMQERGKFLVQNKRQSMGHGLPGSNAENVEYLLFFNMISTEGNKLVQHGLCIPHTSIRHFGDSKGCFPAQTYSLCRSDMEQVFCNDFRRDGAQVEALASR